MPNYTTNYGLHQWEPTDPFLREDFNGDFSIIDAALNRVEQQAGHALSVLEPVSYNVYNLMLQNYYEGKYTGYKKALLFDGFLDSSGIAEKSSTLIRSSGVVYLNRYGQGDITIPYTSDYTAINDSGRAFPIQTPASSGYFTGWTVRTDMLYGGNPQEFTATITCTVKINDAVAYQGQLPLLCTVAGSTQKMTLPTPLEVGAGDRLEVHLKSSTSAVRLSCQVGSLCGVLHFTPAGGTSGSLVGHDASLPARSRILAWARHSGGTVGITVLEGDVEYPMTRTGTAAAQNLQNQACTESAFALDVPPEGGVLAVRVELSLSSGENAAALYDYGVVLL